MTKLIVLFITLVASATAQTQNTQRLIPRLSAESSRMAWAQIQTAPPQVGNSPVGTNSTGATVIVVSQEINGNEKTVSVLSNQDGPIFARVMDCAGGDSMKLLSSSSSTQYVSTFSLFNTAKRYEAFPSMWNAWCLVEVYHQSGTSYNRYSVDLSNLKTSNLSVVNESKTSDGSYQIMLSGLLPKGSAVALGTSTLAASITTNIFGNSTVVFPANTYLNGDTGLTTVTIGNPDGTSSSFVYQRNMAVNGNTTCGDTSAQNYGGALPCNYFVSSSQ